MAKRKRRIPTAVVVILAALACVLVTLLIVYLLGYRFDIVPKEGYQFFGKVQSGQPVSGTIKYPDGQTATIDYFEHTISYDDGSVYIGAIEGLYRHGNGKMTWAGTGDVYEGDFDTDKITGTGTYTFKNGDKYTGGFLDAKKQGSGVYTWADGSRLEAAFQDGFAEGYGVFTLASGSNLEAARYEGNFARGVKEGEGKFYFENGDYYEGAFKNDKRTGQGFYRWKNNETYTGAFVDNQLDTRLLNEDGSFQTNDDGTYIHGAQATYTWPSGRSYKGYFENGKIVALDDEPIPDLSTGDTANS